MIKKFGIGFALLVGLALLSACSAGKEVQEATVAVTPAPQVTAAAEVKPEAVIEIVTITEQATPTPEPTSTPVPDPLLGTWKTQDGNMELTLGQDGYAAALGGQTIHGSYHCTEDRLLFMEYGTDVHYETDGSSLTIHQVGQQDIVFVKETQGAGVRPSLETYQEDTSFGAGLISVREGVVTVEMQGSIPADSFCFTVVNRQPKAESVDWTPIKKQADGEDGFLFRVFKADGNYYLWLRDQDGTVAGPYEVRVDSGYHYVIKAEGLRALNQSLRSYLEERGSGVEALNDAIYGHVAAAGLYSRAGVVTAGVALVSHLSEHGASVTYQGHGAYQKQDNWGANPDWGARLKNPTSDGNGTYYYTGMQCVAAIVWAYKHAGVNLVNKAGSAIGTLGETEKKGDNIIHYDEARSGDIVKQNGHYLMVVDRLDTNGDGEDDSYLTYEMNAPHLTFLKLTFKQVRYREFFSMDGVFSGEGRKKSGASYWEDTFLIPEEQLPEALQQKVAMEREQAAMDHFMRVLGA